MTNAEGDDREGDAESRADEERGWIRRKVVPDQVEVVEGHGNMASAVTPRPIAVSRDTFTGRRIAGRERWAHS
jgi:hypothetical protein